MTGGVNMGVIGTGAVVGLLLLLDINYIMAINSAHCSGSEHLEYITDKTEVCGYYLCNGRSFQADPPSGQLLHPCPPGTSTRGAPSRSPYSPCIAQESICKGSVAYVVKYVDPHGGFYGGDHGIGHDRTTRQTTPYGSGTTPPTTPSSTAQHTYGPTPGGGHHHIKLSSPAAIFKNGNRQGGRHLAAYRVDYGPVTPVTTQKYCHHACDLNTTCVAYDWNEPTSTCWLHTEATACGDPDHKAGCVHVRLMRCGDGDAPTQPPVSDTTHHYPDPTTTTTTTKSPHYPPVSTTGFTHTYVGRHVKNGRLMLTNAHKQACLTFCLRSPKCEAVDYDEESSTCWLHDHDTACGELMDSPKITHYTRLSCPTTDLADLFLDTFQEHHVQRGVLLCRNCTLTFCQRFCLDDPDCGGADYDNLYNNCYLHGHQSVCHDLEPKQGCMHYRKTQC